MLVALATAATVAQAMSVYLSRKRPLIVFAPADQHPGLVRQKSVINGNRTALSDRDLVVVYVIGGGVSTELGPPPGMNASALRSRYKASEGSFRAILVGKDGVVKVDSPVPLTAADLAAEIDRTPLRREDSRRREP